MALPQSNTGGFVPFNQAALPKKIRLRNGQYLKGLLIGTDGPSDAGKTEFLFSIPGVLKVLSIDRNFQGVVDNPNPPASRNEDAMIKVHTPPLDKTALIPDYQAYHSLIRNDYYSILDDATTTAIGVDGDSDWWEIHQLAHFGKLTGIFPQTRYAAPYSEKRAIIAHAFDSGKIVINTNKCKDEYTPVLDPLGKTQLDDKGEIKKEKSGRLESQGFKDKDYLYQIWLRHMYKPKRTETRAGRQVEIPGDYGIQITKCKHNMELMGTELWGSDCNFRGLVELVYPEVDVRRWGFDA
jgi:hypothetical protein